MRGSAPWKTEETIVGLPRLLVLSVLLTFRIFEPCADSLTPDGLGRCRKRRNFGAHRSLVQSCGCGSAALGSPDLILQIWWLSPFTFQILQIWWLSPFSSPNQAFDVAGSGVVVPAAIFASRWSFAHNDPTGRLVRRWRVSDLGAIDVELPVRVQTTKEVTKVHLGFCNREGSHVRRRFT